MVVFGAMGEMPVSSGEGCLNTKIAVDVSSELDFRISIFLWRFLLRFESIFIEWSKINLCFWNRTDGVVFRMIRLRSFYQPLWETISSHQIKLIKNKSFITTNAQSEQGGNRQDLFLSQRKRPSLFSFGLVQNGQKIGLFIFVLGDLGPTSV